MYLPLTITTDPDHISSTKVQKLKQALDPEREGAEVTAAVLLVTSPSYMLS